MHVPALDDETFALIEQHLALIPLICAGHAAGGPIALLGAAGLISTFIALVVANVAVDGLTITGALTWILATLIVWLGTMVAAFLLPVILVKAGVSSARQRRE